MMEHPGQDSTMPPPKVVVDDDDDDREQVGDGIFHDRHDAHRCTGHHRTRIIVSWVALVVVVVVAAVALITTSVVIHQRDASPVSHNNVKTNNVNNDKDRTTNDGHNDAAADQLSSASPANMSWFQVGDDINSERMDDWQTYELALSDDGTVVAVNSGTTTTTSGHIQVYELIDGVGGWQPLGTPAALGGAGNFTSSNAMALSWDGRTIAWSGRNSAGAGFVRVFEYHGHDWRQLGRDLVGYHNGSSSEEFGSSLSMDQNGRRIAIGNHLSSATNGPQQQQQQQRAGQVRVFQYTTADWQQLGHTIVGDNGGDQFGGALAMSGDGTKLAVGARFHDDTSNGDDNNVGHVRLFELLDGDWDAFGRDIVGSQDQGELGYSVAMAADGRTVAIGDASNELRVYRYNENDTWSHIGGTITGYSASSIDHEFLHVSLSRDGSRLAVREESRQNRTTAEHVITVYSYSAERNKWKQVGDQLLGLAFALSGDGISVAVGVYDDSGVEAVRVMRAS